LRPGYRPERQNLSAGFRAAAILAMTRWITVPVKALDDARLLHRLQPSCCTRAAPIERAITKPSLHSYAATRSTTPRRHVGPRAVDAKTA
jgi:hypothetical protein